MAPDAPSRNRQGGQISGRKLPCDESLFSSWRRLRWDPVQCAGRRPLQLQAVPRPGHGSGHAAARAGAAVHRRRQRRHTGRGLAGQRPDGRLHLQHDERGAGLDGQEAAVRVPVLPGDRGRRRSSRPRRRRQTFTENTDFATMTYSGSGDVTGECDGGRPAQRADRRHAAEHDDLGLRRRGLRRLPGRQHRARPARHLQLRRQGAERPGRRRESAVVVFNEGQPGRDRPDRRQPRRARRPSRSIGATYQLGADARDRTRRTADRHLAHRDPHHQRDPHDLQRHRRLALGRPGPHRRGQRAQRLRRRGPRHQRRRLRHRRWTSSSRATSASPARSRATTCASSGSAPRRRACSARSYYVYAAERPARRAQIIAMLDFDMVASPNWARQIYDGDGSTFGSDVSGPNGSGFIESLFSALVRQPGPGPRADPVRRALGLRRVHRRGHPRRRHLHRRRGAQDGRAAGAVRRHGRRGARPAATTRPATPSTTST